MSQSILVTLDSMQYLNTGLRTFGENLGARLIEKNAAALDLHMYVAPSQRGHFGADVNYVRHYPFHKLVFPFSRHFDLVHFTDQYCKLRAFKGNARRILTIHDLNQLHEKNLNAAGVARHFKRLERKIDECTQVVAISNFVADDIARHFPRAREKLSVIYNGVEHATAPPGHRPALQPERPFLFTIGMLCEKKNFHVLPSLLANNDRALVISGTIHDPYRRCVLDVANYYGVADRVHITGPISQHDKNWYYENCEAFVFPSLAEGFGLPVIEAMAHGKPAFLSTFTCLPEVGGDVAYYFDSFEPDSMADTLRSGLAHFHAHHGAEAAMANARRFNWGQAAQSYLDLYHRCL
jgi:glycosyltransferase involved in cell wall biosynthesis